MFNNLSTKSKGMFGKIKSGLSKFSTGAKMVGSIAKDVGNLADAKNYEGQSANEAISSGIERVKNIKNKTQNLIKYIK